MSKVVSDGETTVESFNSLPLGEKKELYVTANVEHKNYANPRG